jgi:hypothetical protein
MALRISVDLDGLRWADLFRFVDLARNGGIGPDDQVDVITYGSDPMSVSLSARIYPASDSFLSMDSDIGGSGDSLSRAGAPVAVNPPNPTANGSAFGYDAPVERGASANGSHYPTFEGGQERPSPPAGGNLPAYAQGFDHNQERSNSQAAANGTHYPAFDNSSERLPAAPGQFAGFETVYDRAQPPKEPPGQSGGGVDSPYVEEFARLQEGLMRQVRRSDEVRPERP